MKALRIVLVLLLLPIATFSADVVEIPLWQSGAPGSEGKTEKELYEPATADRNYSMLTKIHNPSITVYLPEKEKATGAAIVICPGGGHRLLAIDHEGYDVAKWCQSTGVAGFVLKYRLAREEGSGYTMDHPVMDAHRAVRLIRSRAQEWGVDPDRIGIMGFSAGGAVAAYASTRFDAGDPNAVDAVDRFSSRPDFQVLIYPGLNPEIDVPENTPEAFLLSAFDDRNPSVTVAKLYLKYKEAGVRAELHVFARGGHGFGIRDRDVPIAGWPKMVADWMGDIGLMGRE